MIVVKGVAKPTCSSTWSGPFLHSPIHRARVPPPPRLRALLGGCAGAVQDACGGADVHVEGDADVGVAGHAGDVGGFQVPAGQGGGAEHMPQAVPGPGAVAVSVVPTGGQVPSRVIHSRSQVSSANVIAAACTAMSTRPARRTAPGLLVDQPFGSAASMRPQRHHGAPPSSRTWTSSAAPAP